ncbi:hypothetical protein CTH_10029 (plasmid) [Carboxydocella thermautotrophica]|nr:hypothetical protein CTH_10029 [Carboxydocella thermautotrophica]
MSLLGKKVKPAQEFVEAVDCKEDYFVLRNGETRAILEVTPLNFPLLNEDEQASVISRYSRLLNSLYYYSQVLVVFSKINVNKYLVAQHESYTKSGMINNPLALAELKFTKELLESQNTLDQKFYVIVGHKNDAIDIARAELKTKTEHQIKELEKNGLQAKRLTGAKLEKLLIEMHQGNGKGRTFLDRCTPGVIEIGRDYIKCDDTYFRTLYLDEESGYPDMVGFDWIDSLFDIQETVCFSFHIHPSRDGHYEKHVRKAAQKLKRELGWHTYMKGEADEEQLDQREDALAMGRGSGRFKLFGVSVYIGIRARTLKELDRVTKLVTTKLNGLMMEAYPATFYPEEGFKSILPIGRDCYLKPRGQERILPTQVVARMFPFRSSAMADEKGVILGVDPDTKALVTIDLFSQTNPHLSVLAESGAGKTFAVDTIIHRYLLKGVPAIIVEPLHAHKRYCEAMGGQYIDATVSSDFCINPNDLPLIKLPGSLRSTVLRLHSFYSMAAGRPLTPKEANDLDKALYRAFEKRGITDDPKTMHNEPPLPAEVQDELYRLKSKDLADSLERLTRGTYSVLFNGQTNINFSSKLVGISTRNLEEAIAPLFLFNIMAKVEGILTKDKNPAIFVVDEYYRYFQGKKEYEPFALFLQAMIKSFRHYNTAVIPITQDIDDALDNAIAKALITIPNSILLFEQKKRNIETIDKEIVSLSAKAKDYLTSSGRGEGLIKSGGKYAKVEVIAAPELERLIVTDPNRLRELGVEG